MLSRRCTDKGCRLAIMLAALAIAGCGGSAAVKTSGEPGSQLSKMPELAATVPPAAQTMFEQAAASMAGGDFLEAELRFKEFLMQYPGYPGAYVNLAIIHAGNGNDQAAREAIDSALAIAPDHPAALNQLGMLLRRNGKFPEAEAAYLKAVTVSPDYALAHYNLGVLNDLYLQRLDVAIQHFETYQSLVGEDEQVSKWITDLTRRLAASQRTANAAE